MFTTDIGTSKTVLSKCVYDAMRHEDKPSLIKCPKLVGAGGAAINEQGKGNFKLKLGPVSMHTEMIVAGIDDDDLLGDDVLQNAEGGSADLLMSKGVLKVAGKEIPIIQIGLQNRVHKVTAADRFVIPAQSEAIIDMYVERQEYDDFTLETNSGLLVAHFENIGFYIGSSYSKCRLITGFSIKIQVKKRVFQTYIKI